jgi:hypothetical protein
MNKRRAVATLLVASANVGDMETKALAEDIETSEEWQDFLEAAAFHNVIALIHERLGDSPGVPSDIRETLREQTRNIGTNALHLTAGMVELSRAFSAAGIVAVPFKGPSLAVYLFGNVGLRHSLDLDYLVRAGDAIRAKQLLETLGFMGGPTSPSMLAAWARHGRSVTMSRGDGLTVDLQWAADLSEHLDTEAMFARLGTIEIGGVKHPMFSDEDLLLLLCVHGSKHLWGHLYWVFDVAELIGSRPQLDWVYLLAEAERSGTLRRLLVGVALASRVKRLRIPLAVGDQMKADTEVEALARAIWVRILGERERGFPISWLHLRLRERRADSASFALRLAVTPTDEDWRWLQLPGGLWWLYPLLRPVRLGAKYGRIFLPQLRGRTVDRG